MKRHVALVIETSSSYGRQLLAGIVRFMRLRDEWSVFLDERDLSKEPPEWLGSWNGDGIISRATTPELVTAVANTGVPLIEVTDRRGSPAHPSVRSDDVLIGRMGAEHLIERGFERFGFCGFENEAWSERRESGFVDAIRQKASVQCARYNSVWHGPAKPTWDEEQAALADWLQSFEPPFAVMASNDVRGRMLVDTCAAIGLKVPEQVAVVGVDNDELLCRVCSPPLTSVIPNAEMVGYRAAEMLSRLMSGEMLDVEVEMVPPLGLATRQSSDVVAIDDKRIAAALHYIRQHACGGVSVTEVVAASNVSRSTLERQLRKYLGRSPQEEIRHVQVKRVQELLLTTDLPAERIAAHCGFEHSEYMHVVFKRVTGQTPGQFRAAVQLDGSSSSG